MSSIYKPPTTLEACRKVAATEWPDIQTTYKVGPDARWYSCAGHGGIVAGLGSLSTAEVDALRTSGWSVQTVTSYPARRIGDSYYDRKMAVDVDPAHEWNGWPHDEVTLLVGEEDCAWSLVVVARPELADFLAGGALSSDSPDEIRADARRSAQSWHAETLALLDATRLQTVA